MKPSESSTEEPRPLLAREDEKSAGRQPRDPFVPRYVDLPRRRATSMRNLAGGLACLFIGLILLAAALALGGPRALMPVVTALLTFTVLWVLANLRLFRQRHAAFLALGIVTVLGASVALVERGYEALADATQRPVTAAQPESGSARDTDTPLLVAALGIAAPDTSSGEFVKVLKDSRVVVDDKPYLIKAGDIFPLDEQSGDEVTFLAKDLRISLPRSAAEVFGERSNDRFGGASGRRELAFDPGTEKPAEVTRRAQEEAARRYPALSAAGSMENEVYVSTYRQLQRSTPDFFKDAEWPLHLAELIAKEEGWKRGAPPTPLRRQTIIEEGAPATAPPETATEMDELEPMDELAPVDETTLFEPPPPPDPLEPAE